MNRNEQILKNAGYRFIKHAKYGSAEQKRRAFSNEVLRDPDERWLVAKLTDIRYVIGEMTWTLSAVGSGESRAALRPATCRVRPRDFLKGPLRPGLTEKLEKHY